MIDIVLNFRTSYTHSLTGDEVLDHKKIANNYIKGIFWIDLLSVIPFEDILDGVVEEQDVLKAFSILKLFRVLRLSKLITYMNSTDDVKHSLRIINLCLFLVLYVHLSGCVWIYVDDFNPKDERWIPLEYKNEIP